MQIPYELKKRCVEMSQTDTARDIYMNVFCREHKGMSLETFKRKLRIWRHQQMADDSTLEAGTYDGFTAHDATVQVDAEGNIRQAWIKQKASDFEYSKLCEFIKANIIPQSIAPFAIETSDYMLEVPLFDMHFGVATLQSYEQPLREIISIINDKAWAEINLIVGQDLLHTNDMRGHTAKGTPIQQIDFPAAWADAWSFWCSIIEAALAMSKRVNIRYSRGNHDECPSWCFVQALKARYPDTVLDDSLNPRKAIVWRGCFIGYGHCEYTGKLDKLFRDFVLDFPVDFASCTVREIHTGHTHTESADNGFMVRRLSSGVPVDEWSNNNGFIDAHKRFQIFEWMPNRLKAIHYV